MCSFAWILGLGILMVSGFWILDFWRVYVSVLCLQTSLAWIFDDFWLWNLELGFYNFCEVWAPALACQRILNPPLPHVQATALFFFPMRRMHAPIVSPRSQLELDRLRVPRCNRNPRTRAGRYVGAAQACKKTCNPERTTLQTRSKIVVFAIEVGGRCGQKATSLPPLVQAKARTIPARLKACFTNALINRWSAQVTHAAMTTYAASLLEFPCVAKHPHRRKPTFHIFHHVSPAMCWPRAPRPTAASRVPVRT